jgi:hypothetical protein
MCKIGKIVFGRIGTWMRQQKALDLAEAGVDVLAESLQLRVLLLRHLEPALQHGLAALGSVLGFVWIAPVANEELKKEQTFKELKKTCKKNI